MLHSLKSLCRTRSCTRLYFSPLSTEEILKRNGLGFKSTYNDKETSKILNTVNNSSLIELKCYDISAMRIKKLMQRRENVGKFQYVEDLLELDGFGVKVLEKFCKSVLNSKVDFTVESTAQEHEYEINQSKIFLDEDDEIKKKCSYVTPVLIDTVRLAINSVVSFHIDTNYLAWTKFSYNRNADESMDEPKYIVEGWECYEIDNQDKKLHLSDLIQLLVKVNCKIPDADVYVIEALQPATNSKQPGALQVNLFIQKRQLVAMLSVLMASRHSMNKLITSKQSEGNYENKSEEEDQKIYFESVYFLRNFLPSRFYKILVGNERVSSAGVVNNIINYNHKTPSPNFDPTLSSIFIHDKYRYHWKTSDRIHQEYLGTAMLTGLTFLKLCVSKCRSSIAFLNRKIKT